MAGPTLGMLRVLGASDGTAGYGFNPFLPGTGWDVLLSQSTAGLTSSVCVSGTWPHLPEFEIFQIHLDGPVGASVLVMVNRQPWNQISKGWQNYNDPQQAWPVREGDEIQFAWNVARTAPPYTVTGGTNVQPVVTCWMRSVGGRQSR